MAGVHEKINSCMLLCMEPRKGHRTVFFAFFISIPRDKKLQPQVNNSLPQVNNSLPQVRKSFPQVRKLSPQIRKSFPQERKLSQVRKSFSQVRKSFPQVSKSFPQVSKSFPQDSKLFPQVTKLFPQVTKSFPQDSKAFPQDSKIAKCLFYGTSLSPSKIFYYVTLEWVFFGTTYNAVSTLDSHTSYVPGSSKTRVCCGALFIQ